MFHKIKYLFAILTPSLAYISLQHNGWRAYTVVFFSFIIVPLADYLFPLSKNNLSQIQEQSAKNDRFYDFLLYAIIPIHYFLLWTFLNVMDHASNTVDIIGHVLSMGIVCGVFGINVAHELGHRNTKVEQLLSKILLLSSLYMHFFIEHNSGHHKNVSTDEDAASAKKGESIYVFWIKSIIGSWMHAWHIESIRLKKMNTSLWSIKNEMLIYQIIQISFLFLIALIFSFHVLICFVFAATVGILLLETVNYIEHYGLRRKQSAAGIIEKVLPIHSWNSNHPIGRILLFELTRHSDHHYLASRPYQLLRNFDQSPQMPAGYPAMMILSLFPQLWFKVMNKRVDEVSKLND